MTPQPRWVAWPVAPGGAPYSRPWLLHRELQSDVFSAVETYYHHGSTPGSENGTFRRVPATALVRPLLSERRPGAILSPVLVRALGSSAQWIDLYDDWSLAPDINPAFRLMTAASYQSLRRSPRASLITVNSRYMQLKLGRRRTLLVPNGVEPSLAEVVTHGDDRPRLVIMGNFHRGRTDFALLQAALRTVVVAQVLLVGAEPGSRAERMALAAAGSSSADVQIVRRTPMHEMAGMLGSGTVALVPHVVSDYTLSQDLMKVYQFLALGVPTVVPRPLWPAALPLDHGHLLEAGLDLDDVLRHAVRQPAPTAEWRRQLVDTHSWSRRAELIRERWPDGP